MGESIKNNNSLIIKLTSAGLMMMAAKEKIENYIKKNYEVYQEIMEDEEAMDYFNLYYEENEQELKHAARESLYTSNEAENTIDTWSKQNGIEG